MRLNLNNKNNYNLPKIENTQISVDLKIKNNPGTAYRDFIILMVLLSFSSVMFKK